MRGVAVGDEAVLGNLRQLCSDFARLKVVIGIDVDRDRSEIERLGLPVLDANYLRHVLPARYASAGFEILRTERLTGTALSKLPTSWAKRLRAGSNRSFVRITAKAR